MKRESFDWVYLARVFASFYYDPIVRIQYKDIFKTFEK